jgi:hypothetical protein
MKRGLFLCGSGLLGAGAIVGLPMMLAPLVAGPVTSNTPVLWAEPPAASHVVAASTAAMKRGAFLSWNPVRSTRNPEPAAVSTEPIMTDSHTMAVARAPEMVSDPSTQASESPTPKPAPAAQNLVAAPRPEDVYVALPEIPEPVFAGLDSGSAAVAAPRLEELVVEMPEVPALAVASGLDGAPKSPEEDLQPSPLLQPAAATGYSVEAFAGEAASLVSSQPQPKPVDVAAGAEQLSRGSEEVSPPGPLTSHDGVTIVSPSSEDLVPPRSEPQEQWPKPRIFIHHSGRDRDLALRVATKLNNAGFGIAEFRTKNDGPSVASIRYYFDEDRAAAIASRESVRSSLSPAVPVRLQDFRHYEPKPSRGTVEVWTPWHEQRAQSRARGEMRRASMGSAVAN